MKAESVTGSAVERETGIRAEDAALSAARNWPLPIQYGKLLRGLSDRLIAASSLVPDHAVLDVRDFAWTAHLRENWRTIRDEALAGAVGSAPPLAAIAPGHRATAPAGKWRSYFLWGFGYSVEDNLRRCPMTATLVERIPGLSSAFFSILAPGAHIPADRGVTKGLITCHLGLIIPRDGDARMRLEDRVVRWAEGETLIFDDTRDHEVWNSSSGTRVVLVIQFRRPLRNPGRWIASRFLGAVRRSPRVLDARANLLRWNRERAAP